MNTEGEIKIEQSRLTGNTWHTIRKETAKNTICVAQQYTQRNTNNVRPHTSSLFLMYILLCINRFSPATVVGLYPMSGHRFS